LKKETTRRGKNKRKDLTLTGLLMEGLGRVTWWFVHLNIFGKFRRP
jgi:hypothetical protein